MRVSIQKDDPGFRAASKIGKMVTAVFLNGVKINEPVVFADEERGQVQTVRIGLDGKPIRKEGTQDEYLTRTQTGEVKIELTEDMSRWSNDRKASGAKVQVGRCTRTNGIIVQVYSINRPGALKQLVLKPMDMHGLSAPVIAQKVGIYAGVCAEYLCDENNDGIDPSAAAREATKLASHMLDDEYGRQQTTRIVDVHGD